MAAITQKNKVSHCFHKETLRFLIFQFTFFIFPLLDRIVITLKIVYPDRYIFTNIYLFVAPQMISSNIWGHRRKVGNTWKLMPYLIKKINLFFLTLKAIHVHYGISEYCFILDFISVAYFCFPSSSFNHHLSSWMVASRSNLTLSESIFQMSCL